MKRRAARMLRSMANRLDPQPSQTPRVTVSGQINEDAVVASLRKYIRRNGLGGLA